MALLVIIFWLVTGPVFHFSDTWQLVLNTCTTVVTFLMVFLIQASQNRDSKALSLKIDELIRAIRTARTEMVDLEERPDAQLKELAEDFKRMGADEVAGGGKDRDADQSVTGNGKAGNGHPA